jgi:hypothetical protein
MNMTPEKPFNSKKPKNLRLRIYSLIALSTAVGVFFFIQYQFNYTPPAAPGIIALIGLTLGAPLIMGYSGFLFSQSTVVGMLPWLGLKVGSWFEIPLQLMHVENMANALVLRLGMVLPIVSFAYTIGVLLSDRQSPYEQMRPLAVRIAAAVLVSLVILALHTQGHFSPGIDQ